MSSCSCFLLRQQCCMDFEKRCLIQRSWDLNTWQQDLLVGSTSLLLKAYSLFLIPFDMGPSFGPFQPRNHFSQIGSPGCFLTFDGPGVAISTILARPFQPSHFGTQFCFVFNIFLNVFNRKSTKQMPKRVLAKMVDPGLIADSSDPGSDTYEKLSSLRRLG